MTLHIFNPDQDIALASGLKIFTAPHAGRQLRHDLGWLPILWAKDEDQIWVDDLEFANAGMRRFLKRLHIEPKAQLTTEISTDHFTDINPWGWNNALRFRLQREGVTEELLPTTQEIESIRRLSHRRTASHLLASLKQEVEGATGLSQECHQSDEVKEVISEWKKVVVKAPWSSSGRGVRFINSELSPSFEGWLRNTIAAQGSVMVEPQYNKVKDFAFEFGSDGKGHITFQGLSLFHTANGAYTGNLLATEHFKQKQLCQYLSANTLMQTEQAICRLLAPTIGNSYTGPFGIDMMVVGSDDGSGFFIHPCVEINLRHTMGHAALALTRLINPQNDDEVVKVMRIAYTNNQYKLKVQHL
jgi:hypothetical protein